ncbi:MAG: MurR/RpiR family transcriptional regulator [Spirochaetales bacterium]|nr:MurR/RpiR family transcriptional regulator [Spirochaetales bacterium]
MINSVNENEKEVLEIINSKYEELSKQLKKVADHISFNLQDVIFYSISDLAEKLEMSESAIVRFAKAVGFAGFPELKKELIKYYKKHINPANKIKSYLNDLPENDFFYTSMIQKEIDYLSRSVDSIDKSVFDKAIENICMANNIYIFGHGTAESLACFLHFRLNRFNLKSHRISNTGRNLLEELIKIEKNDFAVVYCFHKSFYSSSYDNEYLMEFLKREGIPNLLITDLQANPILRSAELVLSAIRGPFGTFQSQIVPMAITNSLIIGTADKLGVKALNALERLENIRSYYNHSDNAIK